MISHAIIINAVDIKFTVDLITNRSLSLNKRKIFRTSFKHLIILSGITSFLSLLEYISYHFIGYGFLILVNLIRLLRQILMYLMAPFSFIKAIQPKGANLRVKLLNIRHILPLHLKGIRYFRSLNYLKRLDLLLLYDWLLLYSQRQFITRQV